MTDMLPADDTEKPVSHRGTGMKTIVAVAVGIAALIVLAAVLFLSSDVAHRSGSKVAFLTDIEQTFGTPQFDGPVINDNGDATLRDAYIVCVAGEEAFLKDWVEQGLPESMGRLFVATVNESTLCENM